MPASGIFMFCVMFCALCDSRDLYCSGLNIYQHFGPIFLIWLLYHIPRIDRKMILVII